MRVVPNNNKERVIVKAHGEDWTPVEAAPRSAACFDGALSWLLRSNRTSKIRWWRADQVLT